MTEQITALEEAFMASRCDCLSLMEEESMLSAREIANFSYREYNEDYQEQPAKSVFEFKKTLFHNGMLSDSDCPLSILHVQYDRFQPFNFDLTNNRRGTVPIYSPV